MLQEFFNMFQTLMALVIGAIIGFGFGMVQDAARRRNERKQAEGKLHSGWAVMPGSGARVAYLLILLVAIQVVCPILFRDGIQWWVSGGIVLGYGLILVRELQRRRKEGV